MREIKFRCLFYDGINFSTGEIISLEESVIEGYVSANSNELSATDQCTILMQYTGIKDRNSKEIYEGDKLNIEFGDEIYGKKLIHRDVEVFWDEENLQWRVTGGSIQKGHSCGLSRYHKPVFEVVGNIYEKVEATESELPFSVEDTSLDQLPFQDEKQKEF